LASFSRLPTRAGSRAIVCARSRRVVSLSLTARTSSGSNNGRRGAYFGSPATVCSVLATAMATRTCSAGTFGSSGAPNASS
jgi:hypothetical protein